MTFLEMTMTVEETSKNFSTFIEKCDLFVDTVLSELKNNYDSVDLKVIEESGNNEDATQLKDKATEGAMVKIKKTISAIIKKLKETIEKIVNAIHDFFTSNQTEETLKKAEKVLKENPKFKNEKVEIEDPKAVLKSYDEGINKMSNIMSKAKTGAEVSTEEIESVLQETDKKTKKIKATTITVGIGSTLALCTFVVSKIKNDKPKDTDVDASSYEEDDIRYIQSNVSSTSGYSKLVNAKYLYAEAFIKSTISRISNRLHGMKELDYDDVKDTINGKTKKNKKYTKEGTEMTNNEKIDFINNLLDEYTERSKNDLNDSAEENLDYSEAVSSDNENELTEESKNDVEYLDELENSLFGNTFSAEEAVDELICDLI